MRGTQATVYLNSSRNKLLFNPFPFLVAYQPLFLISFIYFTLLENREHNLSELRIKILRPNLSPISMSHQSSPSYG